MAVLTVLAGGVPAVLAQPYAYVANLGSDTVSVIDATSQAVVATVPVGDDPDGVAVTPDGSLVYVANFLSDNVYVIDAASNTVTTTIDVGTGPVGMAISPDGALVYVTNRGSNTVSVIATAGNAVVATIPVGAGPDAVAVTPDGTRAYVTNSFTKAPGTVSVIDTATRAVSANVDVYRNPNRIAITPDGRSAYIANFRSWNVAVVDTATNTVTATIPLFGRPSGVAVHPNGAYAYVVTLGGSVAVIEVGSNEILNVIRVGDSPYGIALSRNGGFAYVANFLSGSTSVVDLATETETQAVAVGTGPFAVAVNCVGAGCSEPPNTPGPTRTRPPTPTPSATRPPTATRVPTRTPTPTPIPISIVVGSASGVPGDTVNVGVVLRTNGRTVAGVQNDLGFEPSTPVVALANGLPDCTVNPAINKAATAFLFQPVGCTANGNCVAVRALVFALDNLDPIADGATLYTCRLRIAPDTPPGPYGLTVSGTTGSDPTGGPITVIDVDGAVTVGTPAGATPIPTWTPPPATATPYPMSNAEFLCSAGSDDGLACQSDGDCPGGVCVIAQGVCDGGADDGLPCECAAGTCSVSGFCIGGPTAGDSCETLYNCAGNQPCRGSQRVCLSGSNKGFGCIRDSQCPGSLCQSTGRFCSSGDFDSFSCVDDADCPGGTCIGRTPIPTPTVDRAHAASVDMGTTSGRAGQRVQFAVSLHTKNLPVAAAQNDIAFDSRLPVAASASGRPDCSVSAAIDKGATSFAFQPPSCSGSECTGIRALVFALDNSDLIPDGSVLYTCNVDIPANMAAGTYALANSGVTVSTPDGQSLPAFGTDGAIVVSAAAGENASALQGPAHTSGGGCQIDSSPASGLVWLLLSPTLLLPWRRQPGSVC